MRLQRRGRRGTPHLRDWSARNTGSERAQQRCDTRAGGERPDRDPDDDPGRGGDASSATAGEGVADDQRRVGPGRADDDDRHGNESAEVLEHAEVSRAVRTLTTSRCCLLVRCTRAVNARAHISLVAVVVVWAGSFSVIKALLDDGVAAGDIAILRYAIAAPGFAFILWRARGLPGLTRGTRRGSPPPGCSSSSATTSS